MEERAREKFRDALPAFFAGYIKRLLEGQYDVLFETEAGKKIKGLDERLKHGIEFLLYSLTAFFDQKIIASGIVGRTLKEVTSDFSSEFSKRMINGVRSKIAKAAKSPEEKTLAQILFELDNKSLVNLLDWLYGTAPEERIEALKFLSLLSLQDLEKITKLASEDRKRFISLFISRQKGQGRAGAEEDKNTFGLKMTEDLEGATLAIRSARKRLKKIREGGRK